MNFKVKADFKNDLLALRPGGGLFSFIKPILSTVLVSFVSVV